MKRLISLIMLLGFFTIGIFIFIPKPAFAYCVYNRTGFDISGYDIRKKFGIKNDKYWANSFSSGASDCCPGDHKECQNATIHIEGGPSRATCGASVDAHGWIVVHSNDSASEIYCNVNEPI